MKSCPCELALRPLRGTTKDVSAAGEAAVEQAGLAEMIVCVDQPQFIVDFLRRANGVLGGFDRTLAKTRVPPAVSGYRHRTAKSRAIADRRRQLGGFGDHFVKPADLSERHETTMKCEVNVERD